MNAAVVGRASAVVDTIFIVVVAVEKVQQFLIMQSKGLAMLNHVI